MTVQYLYRIDSIPLSAENIRNPFALFERLRQMGLPGFPARDNVVSLDGWKIFRSKSKPHYNLSMPGEEGYQTCVFRGDAGPVSNRPPEQSPPESCSGRKPERIICPLALSLRRRLRQRGLNYQNAVRQLLVRPLSRGIHGLRRRDVSVQAIRKESSLRYTGHARGCIDNL
jgi:hypothetical protein